MQDKLQKMQHLSHRIIEKHLLKEDMTPESIDEILFLKEVIDFLIALVGT